MPKQPTFQGWYAQCWRTAFFLRVGSALSGIAFYVVLRQRGWMAWAIPVMFHPLVIGLYCVYLARDLLLLPYMFFKVSGTATQDGDVLACYQAQYGKDRNYYAELLLRRGIVLFFVVPIALFWMQRAGTGMLHGK